MNLYFSFGKLTETINIMDEPKILTLNLKANTLKKLKEHKYNIYEGSLGNLIQTNIEKGESKFCLLNHDFPENLHEYQIVIVDIQNVESIPYVESENIRTNNKYEDNVYLLSKYPQTVFDPRPHAAHFLNNRIREIMRHDSMLIVIQGKEETIKYTIVDKGRHTEVLGYEEYRIYEFLPFDFFSRNKTGIETKIAIKSGELTNFLAKYNSQFKYLNIFTQPTVWEGDERINDPNFIPLVLNQDDEIVSYAFFHEKTGIYLFPCLDDYSSFIVDFLEGIAPSIHPTIFPTSTIGSWRNSSEYYLPNHKELLEQKNFLEEEYEDKLNEKNIEIQENKEKFEFLHEMLLETGSNLVSATTKFLEWLGFENILNMDDENPDTLEEDLQIETQKGLFVIEVKGIGGTSKDNECGQISKIRYRRAEERGKFDVFGLYIVNHQRHLPPNDRENPPFTKEQIRDAINDKRGLLTTYQLYNLYFSIHEGLILKEDAREAMYSHGLIEFKPSNLVEIGMIEKTFMKGFVFLLQLNQNEIKKGDRLFIERNGKFKSIIVEELKIKEDVVELAVNCRVGIKSDSKVYEKSIVYFKGF